MNANTTTPAGQVDGAVVAAFDTHDEAFIAGKVEAYTAWGLAPADAIAAGDEYAADGEHGIAARYVEVARRLRAAEDADLVSVGHWGSDEPMHVIREGVSLDIDEAAWRAAHGIADPELAAA